MLSKQKWRQAKNAYIGKKANVPERTLLAIEMDIRNWHRNRQDTIKKINKTGVVWVLLCHIRSCASTTLTDIALIEMRRTYAKDSAPIRLLKLLKMWNLFCLFIPIKEVLQTHSLFETENTLKICSGTQRVPHSVFMYALAKINYFNWKVLPGGKWLVVCVYFVEAWFRMHSVHFRKFLKCVFMYHLTGVWIMIGWFNAPLQRAHTSHMGIVNFSIGYGILHGRIS